MSVQPRSFVPEPCHLYAVPDRGVERLPHVPAGRRLVLVDLENLVGGSGATACEAHAALEAVSDLVGVGQTDHMEIAVGPALFREALPVLPDEAAIRLGHGIDGAETALIAHYPDPAWTAGRYDEVVVASGDHLFAPFIRELRALGVPVVVLAGEGEVARSCVQAASAVRLLAAQDQERIAV